MNHSATLFTELTLNEEVSMSGGGKVSKNVKSNNFPNLTINISISFTLIQFLGSILGAGGGAGSGGAILGNSGDATGGSGVVLRL
ncbi:MAG: hypothetical protein V7L27_33065 [Nostoc sp.]|uniref:hypothetical protein n=1 Tax=Nostoc sp. TaxID=1180 RepID=UPI002FF88168